MTHFGSLCSALYFGLCLLLFLPTNVGAEVLLRSDKGNATLPSAAAGNGIGRSRREDDGIHHQFKAIGGNGGAGGGGGHGGVTPTPRPPPSPPQQPGTSRQAAAAQQPSSRSRSPSSRAPPQMGREQINFPVLRPTVQLNPQVAAQQQQITVAQFNQLTQILWRALPAPVG